VFFLKGLFVNGSSVRWAGVFVRGGKFQLSDDVLGAFDRGSVQQFSAMLLKIKYLVVRQRVLLFSANANNTANAGFGYSNTNYMPSSAGSTVSSQLCE